MAGYGDMMRAKLRDRRQMEYQGTEPKGAGDTHTVNGVSPALNITEIRARALECAVRLAAPLQDVDGEELSNEQIIAVAESFEQYIRHGRA